VSETAKSDQTIDICKKFGAKIFKTKFDNDYSSIRNKLIEQSSNEWQLMLHPWEVLDANIKPLLNAKTNSKLMILKDDLLLKELRFWKKTTALFERPIYESLEPNDGKIINVMVYSETINHYENIQEILNQWKLQAPLSHEPHYYQALTHLSNRKYDEFINLSKHYLFLKTNSDFSVIMTHYYLAKTYCYIKRNFNEALNHIMECIAIHPLMAEFWCLLGDIYIHIKELKRAKTFFENAIVLGSQRIPDDSMPMELSKYDEYPLKMINALEI
jgi:tetratricopeptide (TPR) repeat protein